MKKIIALSSLCGKYIDDILDIPTSSGYSAIEWDLNYIPTTLDTYRAQTIKDSIISRSLDVRYHLPYSYIDIGHVDSGIRRYSVETILHNLDFISFMGGECSCYSRRIV